MKSLFYALVLIVILVGSGCGDNGNGNDNNGRGVIVPLTTGNEWSGTLMTDTAGTPTKYGTMKFRVDSVYTFENELRYTLTISGSWGTDPPARVSMTCPYVNRPDGFYTFCYGTTEMMYKYPASIGDSYPFPREFLPNNLPPGTATVVSIDAVITVPQGTYKCYHYQLLVPYERNYYLAPNVGWIKWDYRDDGRSLVWELESLILKTK